jgi:hypothetical protein
MFSKTTLKMSKLTKISNSGSNAAVLVAVITLLIIFYILALPPDERSNLLGDEPTTVTLPGQPQQVNKNIQELVYTGKQNLLLETPGRIDYTALNELEIPLNAFNLYKTTNSKTIEEFNPFYIKNGIGDVTTRNLTFMIENPSIVDNVLLSFKTKKHEGILTIRLNGEIIYEFDIDRLNPEPIKIKKTHLSATNSLDFSVSGVGLRFWKTNEYSFEDIKITGDIQDTTRQDSQNSFFLSEKQGQSIEKARLIFTPECAKNNVGKLTIQLNGRAVFSQVPDCGSPNFVEFAPNMVIIGKNRIDFSTEYGSYLVDLIKIKLDFKDNEIPVYYFDIDKSLFNLNYEALAPECGKIDGLCPEFCDENNDYDCCMVQYTTPNWCVAVTANENDRCVGFVTAENIYRCPTNYVTRNSRVPEAGKGKCGDNHDNYCPPGCSPDYDKDCCFALQGDQFWCEHMPTNGLNYRCMNSVSLGQCDVCPTGYIGEKGSPICKPSQSAYEIEELKSNYGVVLNLKFTEDFQRKEADIYVNGHLIRLQTNGVLYQKDISHIVEPGSNSIEIVPFSILNIREIKVDVVQ